MRRYYGRAAIALGLLTLGVFQNCSGGFSAFRSLAGRAEQGSSTDGSLERTNAGYGTWSGTAFVPRGLGPSFHLATHPLFAQLNLGYTPDLTIYVDGDLGNDANPGSSAAPLRTPNAARDLVRTRGPKGNVAVVLRGEFRLTAPLALTAVDSGAAGHLIAYVSDPQKPASLSGARRLSGAWTVGAAGTWTMNVGSAPVRDLYVDGRRAARARSASPLTAAILRADHAIDCAACGLNAPSAATSVEAVFAAQWQTARCVGRLGPDLSVTLAADCANLAFNNINPLRTLLALENAPSLINGPGQYAHDTVTGVLYYRPRSGEEPAAATADVSGVSQLVTMDSVSNVALLGLTYRQTNWLQVHASQGYVVHQADVYRTGPLDFANIQGTTDWMPAAVSCVRCRAVLIADAEFENLGASAVRIGRGSSDVLIFDNHVHDVAGSGLQIGDPDPSGPTTLVGGTIVEDNEIETVGLEYYSSPAIFQYYAANSIIQHNDVHDGPYTGISVGWGWTLTQQANTFGNHVNANHVFNLMNTLADGGGIYLNAAQAGGEVAHNYVHDVHAGLGPAVNPTPFAVGVYLDNGVSGVHVNNNSVANIATRAIFVQDVVEPFALNNVVDSDGVDENTVRFQAGRRALPLPTLAPGARLAYGGMYGYGGDQIVYPNTFTGADSCPKDYLAKALLGTYGLDYPVYVCFKVIGPDEEPAYDFGGMYGRGGQTNYPNPLTGQSSCAAGFAATQVLGTTNVDWPLYVCARPHVAGDSVAFAGLYGLGTVDAKEVAFENPLTGQASCPAGTTGSAVFGTTDLDWPVYVCH